MSTIVHLNGTVERCLTPSQFPHTAITKSLKINNDFILSIGITKKVGTYFQLMKKLLCLTSVLLAAISMFSSPTNAKEPWVLVSNSEENNAFYVNVNSIKGQDRFRYYWKHVNLNSPLINVLDRPAYGLFSYESVDCQTRYYRERIDIWIDQDGEMIEHRNQGDEGELIEALNGTTQASVLQYVCTH